tara:strand:- start:5490 stop:6479 length:990 start_codon:yes stop_codon:yes gene_type:complete
MGKTVEAAWRSIMPPAVGEEFDNLPGGLKSRWMGMGGVGARRQYDAPKYLATSNEKVYKKGNSLIVLGYDRTHSKASGYGGKGNIRCSSIDIVAGLMGFEARRSLTTEGDIGVNPNFKKDAARIYLSQKAAVDDPTYFDLPKGVVGNVTLDAPRSTIALKADTIRVIARENIKLVTRTDAKNSQGGECATTWQGQYGIDLIGMNDDTDMQPLVKGANLVACLNAIINNVNQLRDRVLAMADYQRTINTELLTHTHKSPFYGLDGSPSFTAMPRILESVVNAALNVEVPAYTSDLLDGKDGAIGIKSRYLLSPGGIRGKRFILSRYNNTN